MSEHRMEYRAGTPTTGGPHWLCPCGRWSFRAEPRPLRRAGNNKIEADRAFDHHAELEKLRESAGIPGAETRTDEYTGR